MTKPRKPRRSRGDGSIYQRADGLWVVAVELPPGPDGKRRSKRATSKSRNGAVAKLRTLQADLAAGRVPTSPSTTVERWLQHWATDILPGRNVKPSTIDGYEKTIRRHLIPNLGAKRLDRLQPSDIRALYQRLSETTRSAVKADQVLRLALRSAILEGVLGVNIMDRVDKPRHRPKAGSAFDARTAAHIIVVAHQVQGPMWSARWATGFLTGARESELLGLEWDRIDFARERLDVSWQLNRQQRVHGCGQKINGQWPCGRVRPGWCPQTQWRWPKSEMRPCVGTLAWTRPKTAAGTRVIPLLPALAEILLQIRDDGPNPHNLVFHDGGRPISQETDQRAWRALLQAAEIPHVPQHSIRHSTATVLLEAGVDTHVIQSVIGHSDVAMTRAYQHVSLDLAAAAWANLEALLPAKPDR